jgi:hypothetical protein
LLDSNPPSLTVKKESFETEKISNDETKYQKLKDDSNEVFQNLSE